MSIQLLPPFSLLRDHTVIFIHALATMPPIARRRRLVALRIGHGRTSLFYSFVNYLNVIDIVNKVGVNLHLISMLIDLWVSLVSLRLVQGVRRLMLNIVLFFIQFVLLIFYLQLGARVDHALHGDPRRLFVYLWVIIDWPFIWRLVMIRNRLVPQATRVPIEFVF